MVTAIVCLAPVIDFSTSLTNGVRRDAGREPDGASGRHLHPMVDELASIMVYSTYVYVILTRLLKIPKWRRKGVISAKFPDTILAHSSTFRH
jgi:hypothetical protein